MTSTAAEVPILYAATHDPGCFAARIALHHLEVAYRLAPVDVFPGTDIQSRGVLAHGALPILSLNRTTVSGRVDVLRFTGSEFDVKGCLTAADDGSDEVERWLSFAETELASLDSARAAAMLHAGATDCQISEARTAVLAVEDALSIRQLRGLHWLAASTPTIADIAVYPSVALMRDIGMEYGHFPAIRRWMRVVRDLAPAEAMPGILDVR